jgi:hypothetical protein
VGETHDGDFLLVNVDQSRWVVERHFLGHVDDERIWRKQDPGMMSTTMEG